MKFQSSPLSGGSFIVSNYGLKVTLHRIICLFVQSTFSENVDMSEIRAHPV